MKCNAEITVKLRTWTLWRWFGCFVSIVRATVRTHSYRLIVAIRGKPYSKLMQWDITSHGLKRVILEQLT